MAGNKEPMSDATFYFWLAIGVFGSLLAFLGGAILWFCALANSIGQS